MTRGISMVYGKFYIKYNTVKCYTTFTGDAEWGLDVDGEKLEEDDGDLNGVKTHLFLMK